MGSIAKVCLGNSVSSALDALLGRHNQRSQGRSPMGVSGAARGAGPPACGRDVQCSQRQRGDNRLPPAQPVRRALLADEETELVRCTRCRRLVWVGVCGCRAPSGSPHMLVNRGSDAGRNSHVKTKFLLLKDCKRAADSRLLPGQHAQAGQVWPWAVGAAGRLVTICCGQRLRDRHRLHRD
jgi:hypothetical protein